MMTAHYYLDYIFNAPGGSYETPLRVSSLVKNVSRDDRNVLFLYQ